MQLLIEAEKKFGGGWGLYDPLGAKLKTRSVFVFFFFFGCDLNYGRGMDLTGWIFFLRKCSSLVFIRDHSMAVY